MVVPWLAGAVPDLHEAHAALQQPPADEDLPRLHAFTVHVSDMFRLFGDIERVGGVHLHAVGELVGLDARFEGGVGARGGAALLFVLAIELHEQIELPALLGS